MEIAKISNTTQITKTRCPEHGGIPYIWWMAMVCTDELPITEKWSVEKKIRNQSIWIWLKIIMTKVEWKIHVRLYTTNFQIGHLIDKQAK